jgi:hypothetical protein
MAPKHIHYFDSSTLEGTQQGKLAGESPTLEAFAFLCKLRRFVTSPANLMFGKGVALARGWDSSHALPSPQGDPCQFVSNQLVFKKMPRRVARNVCGADIMSGMAMPGAGKLKRQIWTVRPGMASGAN